MQYEPERTRGVVDRLVLLGNNLRTALIVVHTVQFAALLGILGALVAEDAWFIYAILGGIVGLISGFFFSGALAVVIEWMAQLLISMQPRK